MGTGIEGVGRLILNWIKKYFIQREVEKIMPRFMDALQGKKTYILALLGVLVAIAGHFWGPLDIGAVHIPQFSWDQIWNIIWNAGLFGTVRHGIANS